MKNNTYWGLFILTLFYNDLSAQINFGTQKILAPDAYSVNSSFACDIDGDNDIDVLAASSSDLTLAWYKNTNGAGLFSSPIIISQTGSSTSQVIALDVDNDGDMDVVSNAGTSGQLTLFKNTGNGQFGSAINIGSNNISKLFAGDMNQDGKIDLVVQGQSNTLTWYKNIDGNGTFSPIQTIASTIYGGFAVSDINTDTFLDIIVASKWYKNDGQGNFDAGKEIDINIVNNGFKKVEAGDLDGDNDNDLVFLTGYGATGNTFWYENTDGKGTFTSHLLKVSRGDEDIAIFDTDNDNDFDIVTVGFDITLFKNISQSTFVASTISTNFPQQVSTGDINGDGNKDLITTRWNYSELGWYENLGLGSFNSIKLINHPINDARAAAYGDLDGDGDLDIISGGSNSIFWSRNTDGNGTFSNPVYLTESLTGLLSLSAKDLDGDNDLDICFSSSNEIAWFKNTNGQGSFSTKITISSDYLNSNSGDIVFADLDNDSDKDIVVANNSMGKLYWLKNANGKGVFSAKQIISDTLNGAWMSFAVDMDGDGDQDIVSSTSLFTNSKVIWYENTNGLGAFSGEKVITKLSIGNRLLDMDVTDIDGDNDFDIVIGYIDGYTISLYWIENKNGNFSNLHYIDSGLNVSSSDGTCIRSCADIDNDGYNDLLVSFGTGLNVYSNLDGQGTFSSGIKLASKGGGTFYTADFDGDRDFDILGTSDDYIFWIPNLSTLITDIESEKISPISSLPIIYPTLVSTDLNIKISNEIFDEYKDQVLSIYDLNGIEIKNNTISSQNIRLNLENLPLGFYVLKVKNYYGKFIKQ